MQKSFETSSGVRVPAVTAAQMALVDRIAVDGPGPNLFQMMENAGRALAHATIEASGPSWPERPVIVMAGAGGNGGGGICAARHLANQGADVTVVLADPERLQPAARQQLAVYRQSSGRIAERAALDSLEVALVVDALVGYGLRSAPRGPVLEMIEWARNEPAPVIALDVPSGRNATSGEAPGAVISAAVTLTLALPKTGLDAPQVGELWLADIGIPEGVYRRAGIEVPHGLFRGADRVRLTAHVDP